MKFEFYFCLQTFITRNLTKTSDIRKARVTQTINIRTFLSKCPSLLVNSSKSTMEQLSMQVFAFPALKLLTSALLHFPKRAHF